MISGLLSGGRQLLEAKNNRIFIKPSAQIAVAVAYETEVVVKKRFQLQVYSDLIGKLW